MTEPREQTQQDTVPTAVQECTEPEDALTRVFQLLGKRWTGLVIAALMNGPGQFAQLRRVVPGISERMLSDRLTELATLGLVVRTVSEGPPLRVSYRLTESGLALKSSLAELRQWAVVYLPEEGAECCGAVDFEE
jgi:DNA-binding HxlR family transcriptional regulator